MYTHTYTHMYTHIYTHVYTHVYTYTPVYAHMCTHMYTHTHISREKKKDLYWVFTEWEVLRPIGGNDSLGTKS